MRGVLVVCWLCLGCTAAATPLDERRATQAATYIDGEHPDQPALYALLADVSGWGGTERDEAGAVIVDWSVVLDRPSDWRGAKVLVEGMDAGRRRRVLLTRQQPPWGEAVTEWGVGVVASGAAIDGRGDPAAEEALMPVVVWFVDPDDAIDESRYGRRVRVAGRFLGLWRDVDADGAERVYPVVVGKWARVMGSASRGGVGWGPGAAAMVAAVLGLAVLWRWSKAWGRVDVVGRRRAARRADSNTVQTEDGLGDAALPDEPEAALEVLAGERERPADEVRGL